VLVTLVGWLSLIKGSLILFLSPAPASVFFLDTLHYERFFYEYTAITFCLGFGLVFMSFARRAHRSHSRPKLNFGATWLKTKSRVSRAA
jgi:hypothetical protein